MGLYKRLAGLPGWGPRNPDGTIWPGSLTDLALKLRHCGIGQARGPEIEGYQAPGNARRKAPRRTSVRRDNKLRAARA